MSVLDDARDVAIDWGIWWPSGDPGGCREHARWWRAAAEACEIAAAGAQRELSALLAESHGRAMEEMARHVRSLAAELEDHGERCRSMAEALDGRAAAIERDRMEVELLLAALLATIAGLALSWFLAPAIPGMIAAATARIAGVGFASSTLAAQTTASIAVYAYIGAWESAAVGVLHQSARHVVVQRNWDIDIDLSALAFDTGLGVLGGAALGRWDVDLPPTLEGGSGLLRLRHDSLDDLLRSQGVPAGLSRAQEQSFVRNSWYRSTSWTTGAAVRRHVAKHASAAGRSAFEYTADARRFFLDHRHVAKPVTLKDGSPGLKIRVPYIDELGKKRHMGGYWSPDGKVVTFFYK